MVKYQKTKTKLSQENLLSTTNFCSWWMLFPAQEIVVMDKEKGGGRNNPTYQGLRGSGEPVLGGCSRAARFHPFLHLKFCSLTFQVLLILNTLKSKPKASLEEGKYIFSFCFVGGSKMGEASLF